ncbi:MAG: esterase-like activity of phytase family protein, partial [Nocardioidaceae bacterium]
MTNDRAPASRRPAVIGVSVIALVSLALIGTTTPADAAPPANAGAGAGHTNATCPPHARALSYSDSLDKTQAFGVEVGGLSALARDRRTHTYAAIEDHTDDAPTRIWFLRDVAGPGDPSAVGTMVLRRPDGTPYNGSDFDAEGLTILPGGRFVTSSEVEPSIHVFGRDGVERAQLQVPDRFHVAPVGEAQDNATLEG